MYSYSAHSFGRLLYPLGASNHSLVRPGGFPYAPGVSTRTCIDLPACCILHCWRYHRSFVPGLRAQMLWGNGEKDPSFSGRPSFTEHGPDNRIYSNKDKEEKGNG